MTPKEKAEELISEYLDFVDDNAKQCALLAVDEVIRAIVPEEYNDIDMYASDEKYYWQKVKEELKNL